MREVFLSVAPLAMTITALLQSLAAPVAQAVTLPPDGALGSYDLLAHAVIDAQDHRLADAPALAEALARPEPRLRSLAALALGRIGVAESAPKLTPLLSDLEPAVRLNAAFALGLLTVDQAQTAVTALRLRVPAEPDAMVLGELYRAIGRVGTKDDAQLLASGLAGEARAGAAQGLGFLAARLGTGLSLSTDVLTQLFTQASAADDAALFAGFALTRYKGDVAGLAPAVDAFGKAANGEAKMQLARVLGKLKSDAALTALLAVANDSDIGLRVEAQRALGSFPTSDKTLAALTAALGDSSAQVAEQALETLQALGASAKPAAPAVTNLVNGAQSKWLRGVALETLAIIAPDVARPLVAQTLATDGPLTVNSLHALGTLADEASLKALLPYLASSDKKTATAAADALDTMDLTLLAKDAKDALRAALATGDLALVGDVSDIAGRGAWKDFAPDLAAAYHAMTSPDDVEGKMALLTALGQVGDAAQAPLVKSALTDPDRVVALAAADAYKALTGQDVSASVPANSTITAVTPSLPELRSAGSAQVVLTTTRGQITLQMLQVAPITSYNFVSLVKRGFYDGLTFHRVVPNFVAQGGDPRGDGYGGPGYLIRDEVSPLSHRRGSVGIATAGKDTGGCQFFIDHDPNLHLDGVYTVFAEVIDGLDVVDQLEQGDVIESARLL
jgi:peptidylprolyl isomerase